MSPSCWSLSFGTSALRSVPITVELFHSGSLSVEETTYLGIPLNLSANSPPRPGQASAKPSYVTRPRRSASVAIVSSSLNFSPSSPRLNLKLQPLCSKSSDPPGSSNTPSAETNSVTTTLPMRSSCSLEISGRQSLGDPLEEARPALGGGLDLLGGHRADLGEEHVGPPVAGLGEDNGADRVLILVRLVGDGEDQPLRLFDLEVLAVPIDRTALSVHNEAPAPAGPHVHDNGVERDVARRSAVPVGESLRLGPLAPNLSAGRLEGPVDHDFGAAVAARCLSHGRSPARRSSAVSPCARTHPPRNCGSPQPTRRSASGARPRGGRGEAAPS